MREKLIELIESTVSKEEVDAYGEVYVSTRRVADHLIANGVTIQKWIPVSERLPEQDQEVVCYMVSFIGTLIDVYTYKGDNKWEDTYGNWNYTDIEGITHWMPLPQPPKEES